MRSTFPRDIGFFFFLLLNIFGCSRAPQPREGYFFCGQKGQPPKIKEKKREREDRRAPEQQPICFFTISTRKTLRLQLQTPANERQAHCTSITSCCHRCNTQKVSLPLSAIIKVYARYMNTSKTYFQLLGAHISMFGRKYLSETFRFDTQVDMNSTNWNW